MTVAAEPQVPVDALIEVTEEERDLVRRMKDGEERAFEEFASGYIPGIYRFAANRLRGDPELVRDIVQNTVCKVIEKLDTFRGDAPLFVWLYACCRNEIAGHFRRASSRPAFEEVDDHTLERGGSVLAEAADPERELLRAERESLVHLTLDNLSPKYASALEWKYIHGESVDEIARRLNLSPKAAESVLTRARLAFQKIHSGLMERN